MIKKISILLLFCIILSAGELEKQKSLADSLFDARDYFNAITEYKRLGYFDKSDEFAFISNFKIGLAYKFGARLDNAVKAFAKALLKSTTQKEKMAAKEELVKVNILSRNTKKAHLYLNELDRDINYNEKNLHYWRGWVFMFEDKWDFAAEEFAKIRSDHELKLFCESVNNEKYSVTLAQLLSYILPGSGQFYSGNYLSGLMSLGWNILWGYTTVNAFMEERVFDGLMVGNLLWLRFYRGNNQNAKKFAEQKNIEIINQAYRYLKNSYKGLKP